MNGREESDAPVRRPRPPLPRPPQPDGVRPGRVRGLRRGRHRPPPGGPGQPPAAPRGSGSPGGGRKLSLDPPSHLFLGLVWLRAYPTYAVLGGLFGLDEGNALRNAGAGVAVLESLNDLPFDRPDRDPDREPLGSVGAVMDAFPFARRVFNTKEPRCRRPGGEIAAQKPYHSVKKKARTLKVPVVVRPTERVEPVGPSVPGGATYDTTLLILGVRPPPGRAVVTADATFTHAEVCRAIRDRGGEYDLYAKGNQEALRDDLDAAFTTPESGAFSTLPAGGVG